MKGNFWHKYFRCGYDFQGGGPAARYNGRSAKKDAISTRTRLNRLLDRIMND